jgi:hypothetical protein
MTVSQELTYRETHRWITFRVDLSSVIQLVTLSSLERSTRYKADIF